MSPQHTSTQVLVFQESPDSQFVQCTVCAAFESDNEPRRQLHSWVPRNDTASHLNSPSHKRCVVAHQWAIARTRRTRAGTTFHNWQRDNDNYNPNSKSERVEDIDTCPSADVSWVPALVKFAISRSRTHRRDDLLAVDGGNNSLHSRD